MPPKKEESWRQALHSFGKSKGVGRPTIVVSDGAAYVSFLVAFHHVLLSFFFLISIFMLMLFLDSFEKMSTRYPYLIWLHNSFYQLGYFDGCKRKIIIIKKSKLYYLIFYVKKYASL